MVAFTLIIKCISLISIMPLGISNAASVSKSKQGQEKVNFYINGTNVSDFSLPPIIPSRVKPVISPGFTGSLNTEAESAEKNIAWFTAHGGNFSSVSSTWDKNSVDVMTLDLPNIVPPIPLSSNSTSVVIANSEQLKKFKFYAALAATSYCPDVVHRGNWDCENCLKYVPDGKLLVTFSSRSADINGFILRSVEQKTIHLVFRGTRSIRNLIFDLAVRQITYPPVKGAKVHKGFFDSYEKVVNTFFPVLQTELDINPTYKVKVSGHSLGAAQALLAGMDLYQRDKRLNYKNLSIYTVGCPRVGNPDFAYYVNSTGIPFFRIVNKRDNVPHFPSQTKGYLHSGVEIWNKSDDIIQICTENIETDLCSNSIVPFTRIHDHLNYYGHCLPNRLP